MAGLSDVTREQIEALRRIFDIRHSRIYQEAFEEGRAEVAEHARQRRLAWTF